MIEVTRLAKQGGPLSKSISLTSEGKILSDGSACVMSKGEAHRICLPDLEAFAVLIGGLGSHEAIALGTLRGDLPDSVRVVTKDALARMNGQAPADIIARTGGDIQYRREQPALALIDIDTKGMPDAVKTRIATLGGFHRALESVVPDLAAAACVTRSSTSSGLYRCDTGETFQGSGGFHLFVLVEDGAEVETFLRRFHDRCWLAGLGWMMLGAGGQLLERSLVDRMVYAPERLVFEGAPLLVPPLAQDMPARQAVVRRGRAIDASMACPALTLVETAVLRDLRRAESARLKPESDAARAEFIGRQAGTIAERQGISIGAARRVVEQQTAGILLPHVALPFDADEFVGATVADVLADPAKFAGATLADPLEGVDYGRCKAKVFRRADGTVWINSFAHGRTTYGLMHDAASIEAAIIKAEPADAAEVLASLLLAASVEPEEEQRLKALVIDRSKIKVKPLADKLKAARKRQEQQRTDEARDRRASGRTDRRIYLPAPLADSERLPIVQAIDQVLAAAKGPEPPTRNAEGRPSEARCRAPITLHEMLTANSGEPDGTHPPASAGDAAADAP